MIRSNGLPTGLSSKAKVLVVHGEQDKIISSSTKQSLIKNYALAMVATANAEEMEKLKLLA